MIDVEWLRAPDTQAVLRALEGAGFRARVVGGAVRNALLGRAATDIDVATTALPEQVIATARAAGLSVVPTGLEHGTVTVIANGVPYEVTTLRRDVETNGRHAVVAFSDDWADDAGRRDFTINALYCDRTGQVHDPLGGGLLDLAARRVRFIGDAEARIREDFLRILRFFRFSAEYAIGPFDADGLAAAGRLRHGLVGLSAERIRAEFVKLLVAERAGDVVQTMFAHGFLPTLLGNAVYPGVFERGIEIERQAGRAPDAMLRLGLLAVSVPEHARTVAKRLRLSGAEREDLLAVAQPDEAGGDAVAARAEIYRLGRRVYELKTLAAAARGRYGDQVQIFATMSEVANWVPPAMPVAGRDLIALGIAPGPEMGEVMRCMRDQWIRSDFQADAAALLAEAGLRPVGAAAR